MNSTFLAISIPVFGGIIGFSYIHTKAMRKILLICCIVAFISSFINSNFWEFRYEAYFNTLMVSFNNPDTTQKYVSMADIDKEAADSIPDKEKLFRIRYESFYSGLTVNKISALMKQDREDSDYVSKHITALVIAFTFCFVLTYLFDYIKKDNLKNSDNKNPKENT